MKTIIFDMDGTVLNSERAICESINFVRQKLNLRAFPGEYIMEIINNPEKNPFIELYGKESVSANIKAEFEAEYVKNYEKFTRPYPGIAELLRNCKERGYFVALATNAPQEALGYIMQCMDLAQYFDLLVGESESVPHKPDPTMLFEVLKQTKFQKAIFLGDSKKDEMAANSANMAYLQVTWGMGKSSPSAQNAKTTQEAWEIIEKF